MIRAQSLSKPSSITKSRLLKLSLLAFLASILLFPSLAFAGAKNGLLLWWDTLLPTLLPFMIISGLIIRLRITKALSHLFYPLFRNLLPISQEGSYPIFIGFLAGYPVGAKTTADLLDQKSISLQEGQLLCSLTNNASPMFVLSYIAGAKLLSPKLGIWLLLILYSSSYLSTLLWHMMSDKVVKNKTSTITASTLNSKQTMPVFEFAMIDDSILSAFEVVTKVGGYVVLFSVLASFLGALPIGNRVLIACLSGVLEITTGIQNISVLSLPLNIKVILIATVTAFGGFSGFAQTKSVINQTSLSSSSYIITKLISAAIAFCLSTFFTLVML